MVGGLVVDVIGEPSVRTTIGRTGLETCCEAAGEPRAEGCQALLSLAIAVAVIAPEATGYLCLVAR